MLSVDRQKPALVIHQRVLGRGGREGGSGGVGRPPVWCLGVVVGNLKGLRHVDTPDVVVEKNTEREVVLQRCHRLG